MKIQQPKDTPIDKKIYSSKEYKIGFAKWKEYQLKISSNVILDLFKKIEDKNNIIQRIQTENQRLWMMVKDFQTGSTVAYLFLTTLLSISLIINLIQFYV